MAPETLSIIHFGDIHFWRFGWPLFDFWPKRALGLANLALKRRKRFPPRAGELVLEKILGDAADYVMFSGDLTTTSLPAEFQHAARAFAPLLAKWPGRLFMLPGNHDRYTPLTTRRKLYERAFPIAPADYPLFAELNSHWALLGLDSAQPHWITSRGMVSPDQLARADALLTSARAGGRRVLAMCHYPVQYPPGRKVSAEHVLINREAVRELLARHNVSVLLHGHMHQRWRLESPVGLTHLNCGSAGMAVNRPGCHAGYLKFTLTPAGIGTVHAHWLDVTRLATPHWQSAELERLP